MNKNGKTKKFSWKSILLKPLQTYTKEEFVELIETLELVDYLSKQQIF